VIIAVLLLVIAGGVWFFVISPNLVGFSTKLPDLKPGAGYQFYPPEDGEELAVIHTNAGEIVLRFFEKDAPKTVEQFKNLAESGYYKGLKFENIQVEGWICIDEEDTQNKPFAEFSNKLNHVRGAVSIGVMPKQGEENGSGSSFFIVVTNNINEKMLQEIQEEGQEEKYSSEAIRNYTRVGGFPNLDGQHTVFAQVVEGMDVVDQIVNADRGEDSRAIDGIPIRKIQLVKYKAK